MFDKMEWKQQSNPEKKNISRENRDVFGNTVAGNGVNEVISGHNKGKTGKEQDRRQQEKDLKKEENLVKKQRENDERRIRNGNLVKDAINQALYKANGKKLSVQGEEKAQNSNTLVGKDEKKIAKEYKLETNKKRTKESSKTANKEEKRESFMSRLMALQGKKTIEQSLKTESKEIKKEKTAEKEMKKEEKLIGKEQKRGKKEGKRMSSAERLSKLSGRPYKRRNTVHSSNSDFERDNGNTKKRDQNRMRAELIKRKKENDGR